MGLRASAARFAGSFRDACFFFKKAFKAAYVGSLALTGTIIREALGDTFDPADPTLGADAALPHLAAILKSPEITALHVKELDGLTTTGVLTASCRGVQKAIVEVISAMDLKRALEAEGDDDDAKAFLLSLSGDGKTILNTTMPPAGISPLPNSDVIIHANLCIGAKPTRDAPCDGTPCPHIATGQGTPCGGIRNKRGTHPLCCKQCGPGGAIGARTSRAAHAEHVFYEALRRVLGYSKSDPRLVLQPALPWTERPPSPNQTWTAANPRGDISFLRADGTPIITDLVIIHPTAGSCYEGVKASVQAGIAASAAYLDKQNKYAGRYIIPKGQFVPLAIETGGRFHPAVRKTVTEIITDHISSTTKRNREQWVKDDIEQLNSSVKYVLTALSFAVARSVALTLLSPRVVEGQQ